jgi:hypothetical protein
MSANRIFCGLFVAVALFSGVSDSSAANQFDIKWHTYNHVGSCLEPGLRNNGGPYFHVDDFPLPTFVIPGSLKFGVNNEFGEDYHAAFSGALLRTGANDFHLEYSVDGRPTCVVSDETVRLHGPSVDRLLFQLRSQGPAFEGVNAIDLSLREIDPNLADSLANLKRSIGESNAQLQTLGSQADAAKTGIESLEAELNELLDLGFDEISPEQLDALLAQFDGLPQAIRDALVAYLRDLQADITELRAEIARVAEVFAQRAEHVDGIGDGAPEFDPQDPGGFDPIATGDPPPIDIPAVLGEDPWSDTHDPYAKYADEVLETLRATVRGGGVVQRATFLEIHAAWRYNMAALENILQGRATVTVREWGAFLDAKGQVLAFLEQYIDSDGWMRDAPVTPELRALIAFLKDLDVAYRFKQRAEALQLAINLWNRDTLTPRQNALLDIMLLFGEAVRARIAQVNPEDRQDGFWDKMEKIADGVIIVADLAVSLSPAGPFLDLCRAIGGRAQCLFGAELTTAERVIAGAGALIGGGAVWKAAAGKLRGASSVVTHDVGEALEQVVKRKPIKGIIPDKTIPHADGSLTYFHENGLSITYSREGFADFSPYLYKGTDGLAEVTITITNRTADRAAANAAAGFASQPKGYVWHHSEEVGKMLLIREEAHAAFAHTGGFGIWKKIRELLGQ